MGSTAAFGLPYPEDTDLVISGDDAIQALAERIADIMYEDSVFIINSSDANTPLGTSPTQVPFSGTLQVIAGFGFDGAAIGYQGASARTFMVAAEVTTDVQAAGGVNSTVQLRLNGTPITGSHDSVERPDGGVVRRTYTHRITYPIRIAPGGYFDFTASGNVAGAIDVTALRVYPIGPRA